jgi:hypothetical protein
MLDEVLAKRIENPTAVQAASEEDVVKVARKLIELGGLDE